jgi:hypothetical protein
MSTSKSVLGLKGPVKIKSSNNETDITVPPGLAGITPKQRDDAVKTAIARLGSEVGPNGLVIILAFSHSAINSKILGETRPVLEQRTQQVREFLTLGHVTTSPASTGLTLEKADCFKPPLEMEFHKLNFSAIGAEGCITANSDPANPANPDPTNTYLQIFTTVASAATAATSSMAQLNVANVASTIFSSLQQSIKPNINKDALAWVTDYAKPTRDELLKQFHKEYQYPKMKKKGKSKLTSSSSKRSRSASPSPSPSLSPTSSKVSNSRRSRSRSPSPSSHSPIVIFDSISKAARDRVINKNSYIRMNEAFRFENHYRNLQTNRSFQRIGPKSDCMLNKQYLRNDPGIEQYPGLDWNITLISKNGTILIGNLLVSLIPEVWSTLITPQMHSGFTADYSWMMDLITLIKIVKNTDTVTTEDILNFLHTLRITNVIFIDGGCNVLCDSHAVLTCTSDHPQVNTPCYNCKGLLSNHPLGGGKKKKNRLMRTKRNKQRKYKTHKRYK